MKLNQQIKSQVRGSSSLAYQCVTPTSAQYKQRQVLEDPYSIEKQALRSPTEPSERPAKESFMERFNRQYVSPVTRSAPLYTFKADEAEQAAADSPQLTPRNYDELDVVRRLHEQEQKSDQEIQQPRTRKKYIYHSVLKSNKTYWELMSKNASLLHRVSQALAHDE